jgi:threonine/homoserine/homoserine lactone efflux protein
MHAPNDTPHLVDWLKDRDVECPVCSYNCRGLTVPVCPECAARLQLALASDRMSPGPWALAVVSFALALGFDAVVAVLVTVMFILHPPPLGGRAMAIFMLVSFSALSAVCGTGLGTMFAVRRRWLRQPRSSQWKLAAAIFLAIGAVHAVFGLYVAPLL